MQFLAVLKVKPGVTGEKIGPLMKPEASHAWEMITSGTLRSIHYIKGPIGPIGAALIFEAVDQAEVEKHVTQLPMVEHGALSFEIFQLTPYTGLTSLFAEPTS